MTDKRLAQEREFDGPADTSLPVLDPELRLRLAGGDQALANEILEMFLSELPEQREKINQAFLQNDEERLAAEVHTLCGSTAYCGVPALKSASDALRRVARCGDPTVLGEHIAELNREIDRLLRKAG